MRRNLQALFWVFSVFTSLLLAGRALGHGACAQTFGKGVDTLERIDTLVMPLADSVNRAVRTLQAGADSVGMQLDSGRILADSAHLQRDTLQGGQDTARHPIDSVRQVLDSAQVPVDSTITIMAVGDVMLGSDFPSKNLLPPRDDADALLREVQGLFKSADVVFGNLEGAFLAGGHPAKSCKDPSRCYLFRMPPRYATVLQRAGFTAISNANNHVGDFGEAARRCTGRLLDSLGIARAGLLSHPVDTIWVKGVKIGLCAFAPNSGCCQLNDYAGLRRIVAGLKAKCQLVIASCHMGGEGSAQTHITKQREIFLGENRGNPYEIARVLIDAGADVVIGHGPHVTRAVDIYKGHLIAYSLGNFCTYGGFNLRGVCGISPVLEVRVGPSGQFLGGRVHATRQEGRGGVRLDAAGAVIAEIRRLMAHDIPETELVVRADGEMVLKSWVKSENAVRDSAQQPQVVQ